MRALRFGRFGDPSVLELVDLPDPAPGDGFAVVRVQAASINPSDVKNVEGAMEGTVLPRTPGRDFAGIVEHGPAEWLGAEVFGTGGDLGFTVDGSHAELLLVPVAALTRKPAALSATEAASVGVGAVVAWLGLIEYAALAPGERVAVVGVSGGVGTAVAQLARWRGAAQVIGVDQQAPAPGTPAARCIDQFIFSGPAFAAAVREVAGGAGVDVVFDAVGGVTFEPALTSLAHRGRLVEISATGRRRVDFDLRDFYHNESRIIGADSRKLDASASAERLAAMLEPFESGALAPPPIDQTLPLERAVDGYERVAKGAPGRIVITP
ncbi:MAG TPA: zinc-binding alcohol dehydrogenase family protein [Candidatus Acidoferrales bacterium]|nr:zinc-binding alcohol dehydrogenase family protein [Candidatus Acidoferrales bacterium]